MNDPQSLFIYVVSWNRPHFLRATLDSIFAQTADFAARVFVVDNGSDQETTDIIRNEKRLAGYQLLEENLGINGALDAILPNDLVKQTSHVLISDADMEYRQSLRLAVDFQAMRPLPVEKMMDFDWWLMRDAPQPLQNFKNPVAVLSGGAVHLGWRQGDSTWQSIETPEYETYRN